MSGIIFLGTLASALGVHAALKPDTSLQSQTASSRQTSGCEKTQFPISF